MTITKNLNGTTLEVALEGRLDTMTAPELEAELNGSAPVCPQGNERQRRNEDYTRERDCAGSI